MIQQVTLYLNGKTIPMLDFNINLGCYGSIGTAEVHVSATELIAYNISPFIEAQTVQPYPISIIFGGNLQAQTLFTGAVDFMEFHLELDLVVLKCRDNAAPLLDTKRVFQSSNYKNILVSTFVTNLAIANNLTPIVTATPGQFIGTVLKNSYVLGTTPTTSWNIISELAHDLSFEVFITPHNELVFGPVDTTSSYNFTFGQMPTGSELPILEGMLGMSPRKNSQFTVELVSYHPSHAKAIKTTATTSLGVGGQTFTFQSTAGSSTTSYTTSSLNIGGSLFSFQTPIKSPAKKRGRQLQKITVGGSANVLSNIPIYKFVYSGLTPQQALLKAQALAKDIATRMFYCSITVDGLPGITPTNAFTISSQKYNNLLGLSGNMFYLKEVIHKFNLESGFLTTLTGLTIPPTGGVSTI